MKRFALATLSLFACGLVANAAQGQEVAFFQDAAPNQPTPVTDTLDARLQALEAEAQDLKPTLEEHTQRITKIEDGIKADKEKAAAAKAADAKTPEEKQAAGRAVMEATKAAVLKADASLESVFKAIEEARAKGKGKGDKGGKGKKPEGDKGGKKPEAK